MDSKNESDEEDVKPREIKKLRMYHHPGNEMKKMTKYLAFDRYNSGDQRTVLVDLSCDILVKIFKYLSLAERAMSERIHSSFVEPMSSVWSRQKSLVIAFNPTFQNQLCSHKEHRFCFEDVYYDQETSGCHLDRSLFKLIKKCPNLKNLHLLSNSIVTKSFGKDVEKTCRNLEHIEIRDTTTFVAFSSHVSKHKPSRLKCIQLNEFDEEADSEIEEALVKVIKFSPSLDTFINNSIWNTTCVIKAALPKVKDFRVTAFPDQELIERVVCELGTNLVSLGVREVIPQARAEAIIEKLVKLKKLEINVDGEELKGWYKSLSKHVRTGLREPFEELTLFPGHEYFDTKDNEHFLSHIGRHLKVLNFLSYQLRGSSLTYLHQFCPDLEELRVYARQDIDMKPWYKSLARLTRLRKLELKEANMTARQFRHILNGLPNLKEIHLMCYDFAAADKNELLVYARRHKSRVINVFLDFKLKQVPPPVVLGTKPAISYDLCECHDNLRLWYVH